MQSSKGLISDDSRLYPRRGAERRATACLMELIYSKFSQAGSESGRSVARRVSSSDEVPLGTSCNLESVRPSAVRRALERYICTFLILQNSLFQMIYEDLMRVYFNIIQVLFISVQNMRKFPFLHAVRT